MIYFSIAWKFLCELIYFFKHIWLLTLDQWRLSKVRRNGEIVLASSKEIEFRKHNPLEFVDLDVGEEPELTAQDLLDCECKTVKK